MNSLDKMEDYDRLKQGREEFAAQVEVMMNPRMWTSEMHDAWHRNLPDTQKAFEELRKAAITPSAALREIQARTCDKCHGIGYYDEGHENDDGTMSGGDYVACEKCAKGAEG